MQWQNLKVESGLKQLTFPLSSEPFQGSYKVVVQKESGEMAEHPFTVEEFGMDYAKPWNSFFIFKLLGPRIWVSLELLSISHRWD